MGASSQTLNYDALLTTTMAAYRKKLVDNIFKANPFFYWLDRKGKKESQDGGHQIMQPLMYGKNSTARSYQAYDPLDVTPQDGITDAIYPWKQLAASISISRIEKRKNSGEAQIISLLKSKIMQAEESLKEEVNRQLFLDGTGNGGLDLYGLTLLVEEGSAWSTVAGIDRTAETWWRNKWTGSGSFAAQGLDDMRITFNNATKGNQHPDIGITTQAVYQFYEKILVANERFLDMKAGDAGFQNLLFKGAPIMWDDYCTSGYLYFLNSEFIHWIVDSETDFYTTPFMRPNNQDAEVAQILTYANLALSNSARQAVMTAIVA